MGDVARQVLDDHLPATLRGRPSGGDVATEADQHPGLEARGHQAGAAVGGTGLGGCPQVELQARGHLQPSSLEGEAAPSGGSAYDRDGGERCRCAAAYLFDVAVVAEPGQHRAQCRVHGPACLACRLEGVGHEVGEEWAELALPSESRTRVISSLSLRNRLQASSISASSQSTRAVAPGSASGSVTTRRHVVLQRSQSRVASVGCVHHDPLVVAWLLLELPLVTREDWVEARCRGATARGGRRGIRTGGGGRVRGDRDDGPGADEGGHHGAADQEGARAADPPGATRRAARASTAGAGIGRCGELSGCVVLMRFSFLFVGEVGREGALRSHWTAPAPGHRCPGWRAVHRPAVAAGCAVRGCC